MADAPMMSPSRALRKTRPVELRNWAPMGSGTMEARTGSWRTSLLTRWGLVVKSSMPMPTLTEGDKMKAGSGAPPFLEEE